MKNEEKIIGRLLESVKKYIDYWVICDTGSTDNSIQIVKDFFEKENIPGELFEDEWVNFGHNRTLAVQRAKGDYALLFDADFILDVKDENFKENLTADAYHIKYSGNLDYCQMLLVSLKHKWVYVGVTHEYIMSETAKKYEKLIGFEVNHKCDGVSRENKFTRDIALLEKGLINEPNNTRYFFYLAQSYKDAQQFEKAIEFYDKRIEKGGWPEEVYFSMYQKGMCQMKINKPFEIFSKTFLEAYKFLPSRLETLYELIKYCRQNKMAQLGLKFGLEAINTSYPSNQVLFINKPVHEWGFYDELALCCHACNQNELAVKIYERILSEKKYPLQYQERFEYYFSIFKKNLSKIKDYLIIYNNTKNRVDISEFKNSIIIDNGCSSPYGDIKLNKQLEISDAFKFALIYINKTEKQYDYLCFVDDTLSIPKGTFEKMYKTLLENPSIVSIQPGEGDGHLIEGQFGFNGLLMCKNDRLQKDFSTIITLANEKMVIDVSLNVSDIKPFKKEKTSPYVKTVESTA